MVIKLTVKVTESEGSDYEETRKLLLLAQEGIIKKYASRLMSAGLIYNGIYPTYGNIQTTYICINNVDESIEIK